MAIPTFYHSDLSEVLAESGIAFELSASEASHAAKSRRLRAGQAIKLLNGSGVVAQAEIVSNESRKVLVRINEVESLPMPPIKITIATAIPKGDRQRSMIEMLTQIGVSEIVPLECEHSVTRYKSALHDKWVRWAIEACKQSQNPWLPSITEAVNLADLINIAGPRLIYADQAGQAIPELRGVIDDPILLIGPEGGFSSAELSLFAQHKLNSFNLAGYILRTETAAVSAATRWLA